VIERIRTLARRCGFDDAGIALPQLPDEKDHLDQWLDAGYAGGMEWLTRNREVRIDLRERFPWARSVVVVRRAYRPAPRPSGSGQSGSRDLTRHVSNYAWGRDYHDVLLPRLKELAAALEAEVAPRPLRWHAYVDTGPAMERQLARAAGLGWLGKNTLLLNAAAGSWFFLGLLITDLDLPRARPVTTNCGTCQACQPACPTNAFVAPGVLDASRCISYLTIEHKGSIDPSLRPAMGEWLFGCDLCQTSCPFNARPRPVADAELAPTGPVTEIGLTELLELDEEEFRRRFRKTPLWRPRREGLLRNALIVAANAGRHDCIPQVRALLEDPSPVLRECARWCLSRLGAA
jgi:epoxyqueuosine reductase